MAADSIKDLFDDKVDPSKIDPKHYYNHAIQPINFIIANKLNFCEGNVIKYICRYKHKNGIEDLKKAKQYIDFLIDGGL